MTNPQQTAPITNPIVLAWMQQHGLATGQPQGQQGAPVQSYYNPTSFQGAAGGTPQQQSQVQFDQASGSYYVPNPNGRGNIFYNPNTGAASYGAGAGMKGKTVPQSQIANLFSSVTTQDLGTKNVPGVGNVDLRRTPNGTTYYSQGGNQYAIDAAQQKALGIPSIAGYDSSGRPYFAAAPTPDEAAQAQNTPEANALQELGKTDPGLLNQINQLQQTYGNVSKNLTDPTQQNAVQSYYNNQANALANNTALDPQALQQIQQADRAAQVARGNALGTAPAVQEAFDTGLEGIQLRQNMAQNLASYGQNQSQGLQSYLNSGLTPGAMGSRTLSDIINQANQANSTGATPYQSTYNPANTYTYNNPNAGAQFSQGANNWYNSANAQYLGAAQLGQQGGGLSPGMSAGAGALSGAASGAIGGSAFGPWGTVIGGGLGALAGGLGGSGGFCWLARACYGEDNPKWKVFRDWLAEDAPMWLYKLYSHYGMRAAKFVINKPFLKKIIRYFMDKAIAHKLKREVKIWA